MKKISRKASLYWMKRSRNRATKIVPRIAISKIIASAIVSGIKMRVWVWERFCVLIDGEVAKKERVEKGFWVNRIIYSLLRQ